MDSLEERGLAVIHAADELDALQSQLLEARFSGQEAAEAYLYVIMPSPENRLPKPIVGPTVDFKRLVATLLNRSGQTRLTVVAEAPIIQDVTINGKPAVRALVCVIDELTGIRKWAVKEELRRSPHAATVALEKAEGKALESHPAFNRKLVNQKVKEFLRRQGLNPADFIVGGSGGGAWGTLFGRAKAAGVKPEAVREAVREAVGVGLSEVETAAEVQAAVEAAEAAIGGVGADPLAERVPEGAEDLRARARDLATMIGLTVAQRAALWLRVAGEGAKGTVEEYRRLFRVLSLLTAGVGEEEAVERVLSGEGRR